MNESSNNPDEIMNNLYNESLRYTDEVFQSFVDVIIPRTPGLAEEFGRVQFYGALDLNTDEYLVSSLNNFDTPIALPTAYLLELAAEQFVFTEGLEYNTNTEYRSIYATLSPIDRLRALTLLEQTALYNTDLPLPFKDNPEYVLYITSVLNRFTLMGYYSEWSGYGTTRLEMPNQRRLEYFPLSWEQVGYPGPSLGYRALRVNNTQ
jgi:hypothetical protein